MQKLFVPWLIVTSLFLSGCATFEELGEAVPDALGNTPLMYKPTIQQGNVVTQEMVNKLKPGMNRRQVAYILGTPLLVDAFHQDRWDYVYTKEVGGGTGNMERISLHFEDDVLVRIEGDFRPEKKEDPLADAKETVFTVPDYKKEKKGFFTRTLETMGIDTDEEEGTPSAAGLGDDDELPEMDKNDLPETVEDAQVDNAQVMEEEEEEKGFFARTLEIIGF